MKLNAIIGLKGCVPSGFTAETNLEDKEASFSDSYNTPKVLITTSFAATPVTKATQERQSKPRGSKTG